jgi:murein L,D-transpeptidase YcbB/YkuD
LPEFLLFTEGIFTPETSQNSRKMKTTRQIRGKVNHSIKNWIRATIGRILQASVMATKYSYWFLSVFIFFSCQKKLTQTNHSIAVVVSKNTETPEQKFIVIDTLEYSISDHTSSLSLSESAVYTKIQGKISRFYRTNSFKTKWMYADRPTPSYYTLIGHLKNAAYYGLNPDTYRIDHIEQRVNTLYKNKSARAKDIIDADIQVTEIFFLFAIHLREGSITDPGYRDKIWITYSRPADHSDVTLLVVAKSPPELDGVIKRLQPENDQYVKLQKVLISYRALEKSGIGQLPVSVRASIKAGNKHAAIPAIRKKLWLMDIPISADGRNDLMDSLYYDTSLVSAVKIFQHRHGLEQDGIIGGKTLLYLNQSFREKADLIALNMERMRWLPGNPEGQYIHVNIPEYKLRIYDQGAPTLEMNVIVGAVSNATPVFTDTLEHIVFSPTWTVPARIIKEEFLPRLKKDKMYYAQRKNFTFYRNGVEIDPSTECWDSAFNVYNYRIVQKPGADNALGLAKFIMPNDMNIYLHDTPDHKPFSNHYRALSHGCIRLDDPARLAAYLLQEDAGWDLTTIKKAMTSRNPTKTPLRKQYPVRLEYNTVWADDQGNLHFREDIYGHDKRQLQRLHQVSSAANLVASRQRIF